MDKLKLTISLYEDNLKLMERLDAVVRYVQGATYIDKKTILLIAGVKEEDHER